MSALYEFVEAGAVELAGHTWDLLGESEREEYRARAMTLLVARDMGSRGGRIGGFVAAANMTPKQKSARASKAARARWAAHFRDSSVGEDR